MVFTYVVFRIVTFLAATYTINHITATTDCHFFRTSIFTIIKNKCLAIFLVSVKSRNSENKCAVMVNAREQVVCESQP